MQVTWTPTASVTDGQFLVALAPELIILIGVFLLILITNMGNARFRVPMTNLKLPWLLGGRRFKIASDPRIPAMFSSTILAIAFVMNIAWLTQSVSGSSGTVEAIYIVNPTALEPYILSDAILQIDVFARLFATLFTGALMIAAMASSDLIKPIANQRNPSLEVLYDNRRQVDFHILMLTTAFGMSIVALAQDLFVLFIGLELASMSSYVLVAFRKETQAGSEAGMKYFIVGSVASGVGLYGLSLLYLWGGSLQLYDLQAAWAAGTPSPVALIARGLILDGFGFRSVRPPSTSAPDAYAGAASPVAGVLATASKGMGFIGLVRVLVIIAGPATGAAALWVPALAILSIVTMFWGNIAALGSDNPKRMLAYSSVAHAGYLMGALVAIGVNEDCDLNLILGAAIFHLAVLVTFKLGAFLVLGTTEKERSVPALNARWPGATRALLALRCSSSCSVSQASRRSPASSPSSAHHWDGRHGRRFRYELGDLHSIGGWPWPSSSIPRSRSSTTFVWPWSCSSMSLRRGAQAPSRCIPHSHGGLGLHDRRHHPRYHGRFDLQCLHGAQAPLRALRTTVPSHRLHVGGIDGR